MLLILGVFGYLYRQEALYTAFGFSTQPVLIGISCESLPHFILTPFPPSSLSISYYLGMLIIMSFIAAPYNEILSFVMSILSRRMEFSG